MSVMPRIINDDLILSSEAAAKLIYNLTHPDYEAMAKLDALLDGLDITYNDDGGFEMDCPDINIELT